MNQTETDVQELMTKSAALLNKVAELETEALKVPALEQKIASLEGEYVALVKQVADEKASKHAALKGSIEKLANNYVSRGLLDELNAPLAIQRLLESPAEIIPFMEKAAAQEIPTIGSDGDPSFEGELNAWDTMNRRMGFE